MLVFFNLLIFVSFLAFVDVLQHIRRCRKHWTCQSLTLSSKSFGFVFNVTCYSVFISNVPTSSFKVLKVILQYEFVGSLIISLSLAGRGRTLGVCECLGRVRHACGRAGLCGTLGALRGLSERTRSLCGASPQPVSILPAH